MKTIYKYQLQPKAIQSVVIPGFQKLLSVKEQYNNIVLYALVETTVPAETEFEIAIVGTGHDAKDVADWTYMDTVQIQGDMGIPILMWHIFHRCVR
jgi:hypothetical protein